MNEPKLKTAEEWAPEVIGDSIEAEWSVRPLIKQIQLDAIKYGMMLSANECYDPDWFMGDRLGAIERCKQRILAAAENMKEVPK